jgi:hypothetical protein
MLFSDLALSRRLERAEGHACMQFAATRRKLFPDSGSAWIECAGAYVVFDGVDSPVTQTFGLGIFARPPHPARCCPSAGEACRKRRRFEKWRRCWHSQAIFATDDRSRFR